MLEKESFHRKFAFHALQWFGYERALFNRNPCHQYILTYHGVSESGNGRFNNRHLPAPLFEEHLKYLRKNFQVMPLRELSKNGERKKGKLCIAVTFDDGFENNFTVAAPLLRQYGVPATFFATAISVENPDYILWSEAVEMILSQAESSTVTFGETPFHRMPASWQNSEGQSLHNFIRKLSPDARDSMLEQFKRDYHFERLVKNIRPEYFRLMNRNQLQELSRNGLFEIGSHGYLHYNLPALHPEACNKELQKSKTLLEQTTGKEISLFAFPDSDYNAAVKKLVPQAGYKKMFTENYLLDDDREDSTIMNRFSISNNISTPSNFVRMALRAKEYGF